MATALRPLGKWTAVTLLGLGGVLGATALLSTFRQSEAVPASATAAPAIAKAAWSVGEARVFTAELDTRVMTGGETLVDVALAGSWRLTRVAAADAPKASSRLAAELSVSRLRLARSPESEERVRAALGEAVLFELSGAGLISGIGFEKGEQPDAAFALSRGLLRALVASLQVAAPAEPGARSWTASERDFTGTHEAVYEKTGPRSLLKGKRSHAGCPSCGPTQAETRIVRSRIGLAFMSDATTPLNLASVSSDEATRVEGGSPLPTMSSETKLRLLLSGTETLGVQELSALGERCRSVRLQPLDERRLDKRAVLDEAKLAGTTFASLSDEITRLDRAGERKSGRRARAFAQLAAHLRYDQRAVGEALRRIRAGDPLRDTLIDALGSAGSEPAQAALRELLSARGASDDDRQNVILALSFTPHPSGGTTELLGSLQDDPLLGRQSRYGLGVAAYRLREHETSRADAIVGELEARLAKAASNQEIMEYLRALGNAAPTSALPAIERYLTHENGSVRAAAANALRRIPGARADQLLAAALRADSSKEVRLSAATALDYRQSSKVLVEALESCLTVEPERDVRLQATRVALKWASEQPRLRDVLVRLAKHDPDKKIREVAGAVG